MHFSCLESRVPSDHLSIPNTRGGTTLGRGSKARTGLKALIWQFLFKKSTRKIKDLQQAYARSRLDGQWLGLGCARLSKLKLGSGSRKLDSFHLYLTQLFRDVSTLSALALDQLEQLILKKEKKENWMVDGFEPTTSRSRVFRAYCQASTSARC